MGVQRSEMGAAWGVQGAAEWEGGIVTGGSGEGDFEQRT